MRWFRGKKNGDAGDAKEAYATLNVPGVADNSSWLVAHEVVESLRYMITRVTYEQPLPSRLALVAAQRREGVTYLSQALGVVLAHDLMASVAVVSVNWWWPTSLPAGAPAASTASLADVLTRGEELESAIGNTGWPNLAFISPGELSSSRRPVIARSKALESLIEELDKQFDHLILDVPAVLATSDAIPLASLADACCLVVRQGVTPVNQIRLALGEIPHLPMVGIIMNQVETVTPSWILKYLPQT